MNGPILVTGATGTLGRPLVERLLSDGADVRVMSRRPRASEDDRPYTWAQTDLGTGDGLDAAVRGAGAVVHCATNGRTDVRHMRRLLRAVRGAGSPHFVYISIVGVDRIPFFYYRQKLACERLLASSGLPWTVLRATQFHDLVARVTFAQRRLPAVLTLRGLRIQPVEAAEVAERLAELAQGPPVGGRAADMGGPEVRRATDLIEATMRAAGWRRPVAAVPLPGKAAAGFRAGHHLCPQHSEGTVTYEEYLRAHVTAGHR